MSRLTALASVSRLSDRSSRADRSSASSSLVAEVSSRASKCLSISSTEPMRSPARWKTMSLSAEEQRGLERGDRGLLAGHLAGRRGGAHRGRGVLRKRRQGEGEENEGEENEGGEAVHGCNVYGWRCPVCTVGRE